MSKNGKLELSRRKTLAGLGAIGVASAGAGLGTSAYFSDEESFEGNSLAAGELDLKVDWEEHYWNDFDAGVAVTHVNDANDVGDGQIGLPDPENPMIAIAEDDLNTFMDATAIEAFPDPNNDGSQEVEYEGFTYDACADGADLDEDLDPRGDGLRTNNEDTVGVVDDGDGEEPYPLVYLEDVKPGDFGELTLSFHLCDNPGYVWLQADDFTQSGGTTTEPEPTPDEGELAENIQTVWWYDSRGDNVLQTDCPETLYLTDSGTDPTTLYEVNLVDDGDAELTKLWPDGESGDNFDDTDAIAATPNGDEIIFYDKVSGHLGRYDIAADTFSDEGAVASDPGGIVLAGYSPSGELWAASQDDDHLYTIDLSTPEATDQGDTGIDLEGADLAFSSDGTMYIWTAASSDEGLYRVDDPGSDPTAVPVDSSNIGDSGTRVTGLAIRDAGTGDLVASDRENDDIVVIDRTDGSITERYPMTLDGEDYEYDFGDMTAGELCGQVFRRGTLKSDLEALASGNGLPLDGNRATPFDELGDDPTSSERECFVPHVSHYIGFAWWLPRDVGNEVQGDTVGFDLGFYTEQCRHNDGSGPATETST